MSLPGFLWRYFRRYTGWAAVAAVAIVAYAAASGLLVVLVPHIFGDVLLAGDQVPAQLGPSSDGDRGGAVADDWIEIQQQRLRRTLDAGYQAVKERFGIGPDEVVYFVPLLFVAVFVLRGVADFLSGYAFQRIGLGGTTEMRNDLYRRLLGQSSRFHAAHPSGELVSRVVNDIALLQSAIANRLLDLVQQPLTLLVLVLLLLATHLELALLSLVAAPLLLFPIVRFGRGMRRVSHRIQERMADLANLVGEGVRGHRVVKAFGMEGFEERRFRDASRRHLRANLRAQVLAHVSGPVVESLAAVGGAALLVYAGRRIRHGELEPEQLIGFLVNLMLMYDPIRKLNKVNLVLQQSLAAVQRVRDLLAAPDEIVERPGARSIATMRDGVAYEGVGFAYDETPVLHGIDLRIGRGEIVALVGPSGAGKSTMINLLPRFFDPDRGRLTIDGIDLRDLRLADLRRLIGLVTQDTVLFNDTVRANIAYGRSDLPLDRVREAAAAAYADAFIMQLPQGYDTIVGEAGLRLSGGQRQRLAIARALLKDAPILILDEATSQLDSESEALVQKALTNLMQGRTTLVIAHRLSTVMRADRIVVMDHGRIVEEGTHQELLTLGGVYKRLYDLQFRA